MAGAFSSGAFSSSAFSTGAAEQTGSFTADAVLLKTISGSFTADAVFKKTASATFTADAYLVATRSATFTADAVLKKATSSSFTANAVLKKTGSGSFTADGVISSTFTTVTGSFTADGIINFTNVGLFTLNAVLRRTQNGAASADSVIKRNRSATLSADARFTSGLVHRSGTFTGNAVLAAFTRPTRIRLPMRNRHDRSDHDGLTLASQVTLSTGMLGFSTGTDLMTVLSSLWGRVMNLESGHVTTKFRSFNADAILATTYSGFAISADAVVAPPNERTGIFWMDSFIIGPATGEEEFARVTDPNDLGQSGFGPFWELLFDTDEVTSSADGTFWRVQTLSNNDPGFNEPLVYDVIAEGPWANDLFTVEMRFLHTGAWVGTLDYPEGDFSFEVGEFSGRRSGIHFFYDPTANPGTPFGELTGFGVDNDGFFTTFSDSGPIDGLIPVDTWMRFKWEHDQHGLDRMKMWVDGDTEPDWQASRDSSMDSDVLRTQFSMRVSGWDLLQVDSITVT